MRRLGLFLLALTYLAVPGVLLLHELEEQAEACGTCPDLQGPRLECAADDCSDGRHHHHDRHSHHPGDCRTCASAGPAQIESTLAPLLSASSPLIAPDVVVRVRSAVPLWRSIRGPPAGLPVPV